MAFCLVERLILQVFIRGYQTYMQKGHSSYQSLLVAK